MKFARYLEETQTPEWKKAYIDFKGLKKKIAAIRLADPGRKRSNCSAEPPGYGSTDGSTQRLPELNVPANVGLAENLDRRASIPYIFSTITRRQTWRVSKQQFTTIHALYAALAPIEKSFFTCLDHELVKVDNFYSEQEDLAMAKMVALKEQLRDLEEHRRLFYEAEASRYQHRLGAFVEAIGFSSTYDLRPSTTNSKKSTEISQSRTLDDPLLDPYEYNNAKRKLKKAFQEYYRWLELLQNYRVLNLTGFRKALKKFEKVTHHSSQDLYMREKAQSRRFAFSGILVDMMQEVENIFASNFEDGDLKKARQRLKSSSLYKSFYSSTFRSGYYFGMAIPALAYGVYQSYQPETRQRIPEWRALLEIYSALFIPVFFSLLIGINLHGWSRARINFPFIFELDVRSAIDIHEYFELPTLLSFTLSYAFLFSFLNIETFNIPPTAWPAIWIGVALVVLVNPFPVLSRNSRYWLLKNFFKLLIPGVTSVEFASFWMGDQLCSLFFSMGELYIISCAYSNHWHDVWDKCNTSQHWQGSFILGALPSIIRLVQSVRRYYDSERLTHLINGGKYLSSAVTYGAFYVWRVQGQPYNHDFVIWCLLATLTSIYNCYWDILMDWSMIQRHNAHRYLRQERLYTSNPWIYYFAIFSNIVVRFIWTIHIPAGGLSNRDRSLIAAVLEIVRRFQWNFYRLENEQVGNADQYRATREVPLPYTVRHENEAEETDAGDERSGGYPQPVRISRVDEDASMSKRNSALGGVNN